MTHSPQAPATLRRQWAVALICAAVGVALLLFALRRFEREVSGGQPIAVLFALRDLPLGSRLEAGMLGSKHLPSAYLERRHVRASEASKLVGVKISAGVQAGESLLWSDLANAGAERRDLSRLVPRNHRAMALPVDASASLGGLIRPGDRVDVWLTANRLGQEATTPLLQNVMVLAMGGDLGSRSGSASTTHEMGGHQLTVSVTLPQAQTLAHAKSQGRLTVGLRNPADIAIADDRLPVGNDHPPSGVPLGGRSLSTVGDKSKDIEHVR